MANMDYCMFENTYKDLKQCNEKIQECISEGRLLDLSQTEIAYYRLLVKMCNEVISLDQELDSLSDDLEKVGIKEDPTQDNDEDLSLIDLCRSISEMKL